MGEISEKEKRSIIISILNTHAKTGCSLNKLTMDYRELTGQQMTASRNENIQLLESMSEVICENGMYFSASKKSSHITKMVEEQRVATQRTAQARPPFRQFGNGSCFRPNNSANRSMISYADWDSPSTSSGTSFNNPRKIQNRRKSAFVPSTIHQPERQKRRNSFVGERDETIEPKPKRSRSKSPVHNNRSEHDDRWNRQSNGPSHSRWSSPPKRSLPPRRSPPRRRSPSPKRWLSSPKQQSRSKSPVQNYQTNDRPRSPSAPRRSSPPPRRPSSHRSRSPPAKRRMHSPIRCIRSPTPPPSTSTQSVQIPERKSYTPEKSPAKRTEKPAVNASTPLADQPKPMDMQKSSISMINGQTKKPKKFKFTVIGDGYLYYLMSDMQGELKSEMAFCDHNKTMAEALHMLEIQKERLQQRKKKVLISIGATDLRNNQSFGNMKRDFTNLFLKCDEYRLKPLITTIICIDSPEHKLRADMFNRFLMENFENVVDMQQVARFGLANVLLMTHTRNVIGNQMELGRLQQLILTV